MGMTLRNSFTIADELDRRTEGIVQQQLTFEPPHDRAREAGVAAVAIVHNSDQGPGVGHAVSLSARNMAFIVLEFCAALGVTVDSEVRYFAHRGGTIPLTTTAPAAPDDREELLRAAFSALLQADEKPRHRAALAIGKHLLGRDGE